MRLRRLCLEIFALRRFFKEPIAGVSVRRASEAQPKHRLSEMANAFAAKSRYQCSIGLPTQPARRGGRTLSECSAEILRDLSLRQEHYSVVDVIALGEWLC